MNRFFKLLTVVFSALFVVSGGASAGTIESFTPKSGWPGTVVTITGAGFTGSNGVFFHRTEAIGFSILSDTQIRTTVPPEACNGPITVATPSGRVISAESFVVEGPPLDPPVIQSNSPLCRGLDLTMSTAYIEHATYNWTGPNGFSAENRDSVTVPSWQVRTGSYSVTVTLPGRGSATGSTDVVVRSPLPAPVVTSNSPVCNGALIRLSASTVAGAEYYWWSKGYGATRIQNPTFVAGPWWAGHTYRFWSHEFILTLTNPDWCPSGASTVVAVIPPPSISVPDHVHPGVPAQAEASLDGTGFVTDYAWEITGGEITAGATTPTVTFVPGPAGNVSLKVTSSICSATTSASIAIVPPPPIISGIVPAQGPVAGGQTVTITGQNLDGATVWFRDPGGTQAITNAAVTASTPTSVVFTTAPHAAGVVDVYLQAVGGTATVSGGYAYVAPPDVLFYSTPSSIRKGEPAKLVWNARSADAVSIDQGVGLQPVVGEATVSPSATTTYTLTATGIGGTTTSSTKVLVDAGSGMTISAISPDKSSTAGNVTISIYGAGFQSGAAVLFDGTPGREVVLIHPGLIGAKTPSHPAGVADISVINPDGGIFTLTGGLTYVLQVFDPNGDGLLDSADLATLVNQVFAGNACGPANDANGDGLLTPADIVFLAHFLFRGGSAPSSTVPHLPVLAAAAEPTLAGTISLGTPVRQENGTFLIPVVVRLPFEPSWTPQAWAIQVVAEGVEPLSILRVRRAGGLEITPVYEAQQGGGASAAYLLLLDEAEASRIFTPARNAVVAEIELISTPGLRRLNLVGATTMLMDGRGTTAASQASGTLVLEGVAVSKEGSKRRSVAH